MMKPKFHIIIGVVVFLCAALIAAGVVFYYKPSVTLQSGTKPQSKTTSESIRENSKVNSTDEDQTENKNVSNVPTTTEMPEDTTFMDLKCEEGHKCVKLFLCNEKDQIRTDGAGLIRPRFNEDYDEVLAKQCPFDEICCKSPSNTSS